MGARRPRLHQDRDGGIGDRCRPYSGAAKSRVYGCARPTRAQVTKMKERSLKFQGGHVYLPRHASFLSDYEGELLAFPHVRFGDQVDSTSQALACESSTYNLDAMNRGLGEMISALAFHKMSPC